MKHYQLNFTHDKRVRGRYNDPHTIDIVSKEYIKYMTEKNGDNQKNNSRNQISIIILFPANIIILIHMRPPSQIYPMDDRIPISGINTDNKIPPTSTDRIATSVGSSTATRS